MNKSKRVIIDTDAGADDMLAMGYLLSLQGNFNYTFISSYGNYFEKDAYRRIKYLLKELKVKAVSVLHGSNKPFGTSHFNPNYLVHGMPESGKEKESIFCIFNQWIFDFFLKLYFKFISSSVSYLSIGPLTNLNKIMEMGFGKKLNKVVIMGGLFNMMGNATSVAEANIFWDPISAKNVFMSGIPIYLVPLDVTSKIFLNKKDLIKFENYSSEFYYKIFSHYSDYYVGKKNVNGRVRTGKDIYYRGGVLHDLVAAVFLNYPEIFTFREQYIDLESIVPSGEIKIARNNKRSTLLIVVNGVDIDSFWKHIGIIMNGGGSD